jgi:hypothetical protein
MSNENSVAAAMPAIPRVADRLPAFNPSGSLTFRRAQEIANRAIRNINDNLDLVGERARKGLLSPEELGSLLADVELLYEISNDWENSIGRERFPAETPLVAAIRNNLDLTDRGCLETLLAGPDLEDNE